MEYPRDEFGPLFASLVRSDHAIDRKTIVNRVYASDAVLEHAFFTSSSPEQICLFYQLLSLLIQPSSVKILSTVEESVAPERCQQLLVRAIFNPSYLLLPVAQSTSIVIQLGLINCSPNGKKAEWKIHRQRHFFTFDPVLTWLPMVGALYHLAASQSLLVPCILFLRNLSLSVLYIAIVVPWTSITVLLGFCERIYWMVLNRIGLYKCVHSVQLQSM